MIAPLALLAVELTLAVAGPPGAVEYLPVHLMQAEAHRAPAGLRASLVPARTEAEAAEALAAGRVELAVTSLDSAVRLGHVKGAPPRLVLGLTAAPPVALLVPRARAGAVADLGRLAGETVGIPGPGTREHRLLLALLARADLRVSQLTLASFGERGLARAIAGGRVAAGVIGDPWASRLIADGEAVALADLRRPEERTRWLGGPSVEVGLFLRVGSRLGGPELAPLLRGLLDAVERARTEPPAALAAALPAGVAGDPADFAARLEGARGIYLEQGRVAAAALEASLDRLPQRLPVPAEVKLPRAGRMLFLEPLERALAGPR